MNNTDDKFPEPVLSISIENSDPCWPKDNIFRNMWIGIDHRGISFLIGCPESQLSALESRDMLFSHDLEDCGFEAPSDVPGVYVVQYKFWSHPGHYFEPDDCGDCGFNVMSFRKLEAA